MRAWRKSGYHQTCLARQNEPAIILGIRLATVQEHVADTLRKLEVENRQALTVLCMGSPVPWARAAPPYVWVVILVVLVAGDMLSG